MSEAQTEVVAKPKAEVTTVKLQDGRTVEFAGKRRMLKTTTIDGGKVSVRLDFRNGETRTFVLPDSLLLQFAGHGAEQKLGDETAGTPDVDDMVLEVDELIERLSKGEWGTVRAAGNGMAGTSVLLRALVQLTGKPVDEVKAKLKGMSQAEKMALRNSAKVKPIVDQLEASKVAKASNIDTDALLAGI